jgi:hypothetical protein
VRGLRGVAGRQHAGKPTADGASASPAPVAVSVATSVSAPITVAVAASTAASTRVAVAATRIGGIGALHVGTGVVGRLRSVAEAVVVAWPLTVAIARPGTIPAGTCRPAAAAARASNAAAVAAGRSAATNRVPANGSARRCISWSGSGKASACGSSGCATRTRVPDCACHGAAGVGSTPARRGTSTRRRTSCGSRWSADCDGVGARAKEPIKERCSGNSDGSGRLGSDVLVYRTPRLRTDGASADFLSLDDAEAAVAVHGCVGNGRLALLA